MKTGVVKTLTGGLAVAAVALLLSAAPASAQSRAECRCVDRDGNEIERCTCVRAPRAPGLLGWLAPSDARPRLGISVDVSQSTRRDASGALVTDVLEDGPADEVGIRRGDFITAIGGQSLFEPMERDVEEGFDLDRSVPVQRLLAIARELEAGEEVEVEYERDGERRTVMLEAQDLADSWGSGFGFGTPGWDADRFREQLRELSDDARAFRFRSRGRRDDWAPAPPPPPGARGNVRIFGGDGLDVILDRYRGVVDGLELVALNPELGAYFGVEEGVLVADVHDDARLDLQPGDVVLRVGERSVTTPDRMRRILRSFVEDEEITLHIRRDGREMTVTGRLGG